ncbi:MAG: hypothetical protein A3G24_00265 [Betaproteobacteria bacterium RIFCSPLOWO2_12_FULL_62_13]|nr:MAG: hypothetical protein A3G24_00265 [Betaproteobacteria bacterium RIFCSPLOWO2_12_FULL_62_13]
MRWVLRAGALEIAVLGFGCATVQSIQAECENRHPDFVDMVECLKQEAAAGSLGQSRDARTYLAHADTLAHRAKAGEITHRDARAALREMYVKIAQTQAAQAALPRADSAPPRRPMICVPRGSGVSCF